MCHQERVILTRSKHTVRFKNDLILDTEKKEKALYFDFTPNKSNYQFRDKKPNQFPEMLLKA